MKKLLLLLLLSGCTVGPVYHPPRTPMPPAFIEARAGKTYEISDAELACWWKKFHDPFLDKLQEEALRYNLDYRIAIERIYQARSVFRAQFAQMFPEIDANAHASRSRLSQSVRSSSTSTASTTTTPTPTPSTSTLSPFQNFFQVGLVAIWEPDFFGKLLHATRATQDLWQASEEDAKTVRILVLSEVATEYNQICALQKKVGISKQIVALDSEVLKLSSDRLQSGLANEQEVNSASVTLDQDKASLKTLETALAQSIHSLALLLGTTPEALVNDFAVERPLLHATGRVPAGLPSILLRRRPDILSAERQLAAATEQIGVAVADLFPQFSLTGSSSSFAANGFQGANVGFSSDKLSHLFKLPSRMWGIGGSATLPLFDFGRRKAVIAEEVALQRQSYFAYKKVVLTALREVEDALVAYFHEEQRVEALQGELYSNQRTLTLTLDLFQAGLNNYTQIVQAKGSYFSSLSTLTDSQALLSNDLIALYKALGGDW